MNINFNSMSVEEFLRDYWQKKPVLIKAGIENFTNPVEADELAGLAGESNIESRLIYKKDNQWMAESGPFEDYQRLGDDYWSLVVQSVNHWSPEAQAFAQLFDFIPQWRFDDVMISFAAPNGGVGPHVDNYDVFICQGSGQRHWKVGAKNDYEQFTAHEKLLHVKPFTPVIDEVVSEGDILYIPPGFPHEGISLDSSMSFSVGYKSVNSTELLSGFADYLIDFDTQPTLLTDQDRKAQHYGQISSTDSDLLQQFLHETINDSRKFSDFLGISFSQSRSELDMATEEYSFEEWLGLFESNPLHKLYAVKMLYLDNTIADGQFYVDGEVQTLPSADNDDIRFICNNSQVKSSDITHDAVLHWLWESTNRGYWYFDL